MSLSTSTSTSTQSHQLTIFGSTGPSGTALALAALNRGYSLVLFVRSPQKLRKELQEGEKIKVIVGNLDEREKIKDAIKGSIAILSTLGPLVSIKSASPFPSGQTPIADVTAFILENLDENQKFVAIATPTAFKEGDDRGLTWTLGVGFIKTFARPAWEEMTGIGKAFSNSKHSSRVLVRVPLLSSSSEISSKGVKVSLSVGKGGTFSRASGDSGGAGLVLYREDLAEFMLDCLTTQTWDGKWPHISSP